MQRDAVPMCSNASMRACAWRTHPPPCPKPQSLLTQHPAHSGAPCAQHNTLWVATTSPSVNQWRLPTKPPAAVTSPECKVFPGGGGCCCGYWGVRGAHEQELLLLGVRGACEEGASMCPRRAASLSTGLDEVREVSAFCAHCTQACIFIFAHTHTHALPCAHTHTHTPPTAARSQPAAGLHRFRPGTQPLGVGRAQLSGGCAAGARLLHARHPPAVRLQGAALGWFCLVREASRVLRVPLLCPHVLTRAHEVARTRARAHRHARTHASTHTHTHTHRCLMTGGTS